MFAVINLNSQLVYAPYFIDITVPIEYDNNSSQTQGPNVFSTVKQSVPFFIHPVYKNGENKKIFFKKKKKH